MELNRKQLKEIRDLLREKQPELTAEECLNLLDAIAEYLETMTPVQVAPPVHAPTPSGLEGRPPAPPGTFKPGTLVAGKAIGEEGAVAAGAAQANPRMGFFHPKTKKWIPSTHPISTEVVPDQDPPK